MNRKIVWLAFITVLSLSTVFGTIWSRGLVAPTSTRTWTVGLEGHPKYDFDNIGDAIKNASVGDTIRVAAGLYAGKDAFPIEHRCFYIGKSLNLIGDNRNNTIIDGSEAIAPSIFVIYGSDVTISNFTIRDAYGGTGIWIEGDNISITGNNVTNNDEYGIRIEKGEEIKIANNIMTVNTDGIYVFDYCNNSVFSNNIISGHWRSPSPKFNMSMGIRIEAGANNRITENEITNCRYGIRIEDSPASTSNNNTMTENTIMNCDFGIYTSSNSDFIGDNDKRNKKRAIISDCITGIYCPDLNKATFQNNDLQHLSQGIHLSNANQCTIRDNNLQNISNSCIYLFDSSQCTILNNNFTNISHGCMNLSDVSQCTITDNTFNHISHDCIYLSDVSQCTIRNNFFYDCNQSICLYNSNSTTIMENTIFKCRHYGVHVHEGCNDYVIYHNDFFDNGLLVNGTQVLDKALTNHLDNGTRGNYWSNYEGEDRDGNRIGDTPHYTDYCPLVVPIGSIPVVWEDWDWSTLDWEDKRCDCNVLLGNYATLSGFYFNQTTKSIGFNVTFGRIGYCNITVAVPNQPLNGAFKVYVDNIAIPCIVDWDATHYSINFTCFASSRNLIQNIGIEAEANYLGDINNDGKVDLFDVVLLAKDFGKES